MLNNLNPLMAFILMFTFNATSIERSDELLFGENQMPRPSMF